MEAIEEIWGFDLPAEAEVIVAALDVFDEPDDTSTAPGRLRRGDRVMVREGLAPGDRVVTLGAALLHDGQAVRVIP